jgi:cystathionine beta-synthase
MESRANTPYQMLLINWLAKVTNDSIHQSARPDVFIGEGGDIDAVVVGVGSGGTLTGVGRYMKSRSPKTEMILADPAGSVLAPYVETGRLIEERLDGVGFVARGEAP